MSALLAVVTFGLTWLASAAPLTAAEERIGPGTHDLRVAVDSLDPGDAGRALERSYILHVPPGSRDRAAPLVIAFHGGGGRASGYREYAGLDAVADREGFLVVYPDGSGRLGRRLLTWNAGRCCGSAMRDRVDDVGFVRALVEDVSTRIEIDRTRIYATGHSNGAMMSYRIGAEAPDLVAAIAPVAGALMLEAFDATHPMPVLHIHSVDDPRALYAGGLGPPFPLTRSRVDHNAVESELHRWIALNGCPRSAALADERTDPSTGHTAKLLRWGRVRRSPRQPWGRGRRRRVQRPRPDGASRTCTSPSGPIAC